MLKLREQDQRSIFHEVAWKKGAAIRITQKNEIVYEQWCEMCRRAAKGEFGETNTRAVDIERGIFHLIQTGRASLAAEIVVSI